MSIRDSLNWHKHRVEFIFIPLCFALLITGFMVCTAELARVILGGEGTTLWLLPLTIALSCESTFFSFYWACLNLKRLYRATEVLVVTCVSAMYTCAGTRFPGMTGYINEPEYLVDVLIQLIPFATWTGSYLLGIMIGSLLGRIPVTISSLAGVYADKPEDPSRYGIGFAYPYLHRIVFRLFLVTVAAVLYARGCNQEWTWLENMVVMSSVTLLISSGLAGLNLARLLLYEDRWEKQGIEVDPGMRSAWVRGMGTVIAVVVLIALVIPVSISPVGARSFSHLGERLNSIMQVFTNRIWGHMMDTHPERQVQSLGQHGGDPFSIFLGTILAGITVVIPDWLIQMAEGIKTGVKVFIAISVFYLLWQSWDTLRRLAFRLSRKNPLRWVVTALDTAMQYVRQIWTALVDLITMILSEMGFDKRGQTIRSVLHQAFDMTGVKKIITGTLKKGLSRIRIPADPAAYIRHLFARLLLWGHKHRLGRKPGETAAEYAHYLQTGVDEESPQLEALVENYELVRYSTRPPAETSLHVLGRIYKDIIRVLRLVSLPERTPAAGGNSKTSARKQRFRVVRLD